MIYWGGVSRGVDFYRYSSCRFILWRRMPGKTMTGGLNNPFRCWWASARVGRWTRTARMVNDGLQHAGLIPGGGEAVNRPGGGHSVALNALLNQPGDAERIQVVNTPFITNKLLGRIPIDYRQFTPLALLFSERFLFAVRSDSPIKDCKDLIAKLRQDPASVSFSVSSGVGTVNYAAAMELAKAIGADIHKIKAVSFGSAAEGVTATLGGHIDVVITTPSSLVPLCSGRTLAGAGVSVCPAPSVNSPSSY
ncbi:MAG: tripartite tricarboxylate transporter substrate-binding protein [Sodalis sp. (in: enterobacteria)]|uniref:tripartite tricarboxylate transporter substrate-binding protein n=1 Tax=Sodalis sp. (in: enterobacteria) TaxID=1898979 RepID=UPI0039E2BF1E